MKTRKILPLVLLAVGALFLLSGCDAILNAIFPDNQIFVDVRIRAVDYPVDWSHTFYSGAYPGTVTLTLTDVNTGSVTIANGSWTSVDTSFIHFPFTFTKLKSDTFNLTAVYTSTYEGGPYVVSTFYDPSGNYLSAIAMPYTNSGDSTGHSVNLYMIF